MNIFYLFYLHYLCLKIRHKKINKQKNINRVFCFIYIVNYSQVKMILYCRNVLLVVLIIFFFCFLFRYVIPICSFFYVYMCVFMILCVCVCVRERVYVSKMKLKKIYNIPLTKPITALAAFRPSISPISIGTELP
jgi:hypothetical protein